MPPGSAVHPLDPCDTKFLPHVRLRRATVIGAVKSRASHRGIENVKCICCEDVSFVPCDETALQQIAKAHEVHMH